MDNKNSVENYAKNVKNANNRTIFRNNILTCQFLKNYSGIKLFADISPDDIEDVSEKYKAMLGVEFEADTVKRVRICADDGKESYIYVLPLIEHKSYVDYDVSMQMLKYMVLIWQDYKNKQEGLQKGISKTKGFRYPLIIPIVYYEGKENWTAEFNVRNRIAFGDIFKDFIPDYNYHIFHVHDCSNEELLKMQDEMSLVLMINKIQSPRDFAEFLEGPREYVEKLYKNAPKEIQEIYLTIIWSLLMKMKYPVDEAEGIIEQIEETSMGYLFENAENMSILEAREDRKEAKRLREEAEQINAEIEIKAKENERKAEENERKAEENERKAEENERKAEENERKAEENERKAEENERKAEENERKAEENERKAEENERKAEENERKAEENERKAEENERKAEENEIIGVRITQFIESFITENEKSEKSKEEIKEMLKTMFGLSEEQVEKYF